MRQLYFHVLFEIKMNAIKYILKLAYGIVCSYIFFAFAIEIVLITVDLSRLESYIGNYEAISNYSYLFFSALWFLLGAIVSFLKGNKVRNILVGVHFGIVVSLYLYIYVLFPELL